MAPVSDFSAHSDSSSALVSRNLSELLVLSCASTLRGRAVQRESRAQNGEGSSPGGGIFSTLTAFVRSGFMFDS